MKVGIGKCENGANVGECEGMGCGCMWQGRWVRRRVQASYRYYINRTTFLPQPLPFPRPQPHMSRVSPYPKYTTLNTKPKPANPLRSLPNTFLVLRPACQADPKGKLRFEDASDAWWAEGSRLLQKGGAAIHQGSL